MNKKRVFIYVEGGLIQTVATDPGVEVMILDGDISEDVDTSEIDGTRKYKDMDGDEFEAVEALDQEAIEGPGVVDNYFKQRKKNGN